MSTFNKLFCEKLYERGVAIDKTALKGPLGPISEGEKDGLPGANGKLKVQTIIVLSTDTLIKIPKALDSEYKAYQIVKPIATLFDVQVTDHLDVKILTLYKQHVQDLLVYKNNTEWVF
jgi:hypothetical protein